jgi:hypothetical protein
MNFVLLDVNGAFFCLTFAYPPLDETSGPDSHPPTDFTYKLDPVDSYRPIRLRLAVWQ